MCGVRSCEGVLTAGAPPTRTHLSPLLPRPHSAHNPTHHDTPPEVPTDSPEFVQYAAQASLVVRRRLQLGGARLAQVLNAAVAARAQRREDGKKNHNHGDGEGEEGVEGAAEGRKEWDGDADGRAAVGGDGWGWADEESNAAQGTEQQQRQEGKAPAEEPPLWLAVAARLFGRGSSSSSSGGGGAIASSRRALGVVTPA